MDEDCRNCPALCETRERVVHGYGDVAADFLFVGERPTARADETGVPFAGAGGSDGDGGLRRMLERLGLCAVASPADAPALENVYVTHLTRCRDPDRRPTDAEIDTCEPYLSAEIRMINPEILIPVGERTLSELGREYTTTPAADLGFPDAHARRIRGRGFELVPMIEPREQTAEQTQNWLEAFVELMASDYRQTKGRQER
ncbi:uracil-DNA glycosylase [Natrinema thermotolerans]|uniref:Uracil-DNA glycosylase n=1 Tax=Natrinema thermotolerans TaxID=121872 RepID=A0AAF0PFE2_9EURY|nr:uracil-DNA glycosylase [Natrinema thermotolerans]QCC57647.1 uracil-DNA glycosylase [Natrinema thermotolerans]WMT10161.1 uracil-DNA glycosylase [Natrinema thermotolerans]